MKRRIMALILGILAVLPTAVSATSDDSVKGGTQYVFQNYETEDSAYFVTGTDDLIIAKITEDDNTYAMFEPGTELMYKNFLGTPVPEDFSVIVDLCKVAEPALGWQFHVYTAKGNRIKWSILAADMQKDVWYTYLTIRKNDVLKTYRAIKGSDEYEEVEVAGCADISSGTNMFSVAFWKTYGAESGATIETTKFYADNIGLFAGTFAVPNTAKITVSDEAGNKKITASADIISDEATAETRTIAPILVIFDSKNKIMNWVPKTSKAGLGRTTQSNEILLTADEFEAVRGGMAELYLWESVASFMPITKGYRCAIQ